MNKLNWAVVWALLASLGLAVSPAQAQELFKKRVGAVKYGDVKAGVLEVPFLTWGGDAATFLANGGKETTPDSIFGKMGLKLKLVNGDNFHDQVRNYISGKTPFVRGTFSMLGQASEVLNHNAQTKPVVFLQMTWSAGDHMVARENCKTLNDLKGKKIALQEDGPHVGMLDDILRTAGFRWRDVTVVWTKDVTGKDSPSEKFRADNSIDACFVISPDMQKVTGGLRQRGTGADNTVKGAHVLVSTVDMKRSIADVYAVRKDFFDANKSLIEKFTAGYLKGCEELLQMKARSSRDKAALARYKQLLKLTQDLLGKEAVPSDEDADGLISDAVFVGLPGNRAFFKDAGNESGFEAKQKHALDLAVGEKYAEARTTFVPVDFNYQDIARLADLPASLVDQPRVSLPTGVKLGETLFTFVITFGPSQKDFPEEKYADDFRKAVEQASLFGNALVTIRGHADPTRVVQQFVDAAEKKKVLTKKEEGGKTAYYLRDGKKIDLDDPKSMHTVVEILRKEDFSSARDDPKETLELCEKLAQNRANRVHEALLKYAAGKRLILDKNQIKPVGVSILEPVFVNPKNDDETAKNRRVEFRISRILGNLIVPTEKTIYDY
jgi:ABC-type nitrate/sulfonate/bicarbonate transport system substrate-binding protein